MTALENYIAKMPGIMKLTLIKLAIDPPTFEDGDCPKARMVLDHFVDIGLALSTTDGARRSYCLTQFGVTVYDIVKTHNCNDASIVANDLDDEFPAGAA